MNFRDLFRKIVSYFELNDVWVSGTKLNVDSFKEHVKQRICFTYRHSFAPLGEYTSDSGWGCMIRVGQSLIFDCLLRLDSFENVHFI